MSAFDLLPTPGATLLTGADWSAEPADDTLPVIDPSTGEEIYRLAAGGAAAVDRAVTAARAAADGPWGALPAVEKGRLLVRLSRAIEDHFEALWHLESHDTGKPVKQAKADITACARYFEFYGGAADKHHGETIPYQAGYSVLTWKEPYGVTGHIIPWNYPAQIFGRTIGGALAAGNACVLKPAEDACLTPLALAQLALAVGFPPGALTVVTGLGTAAGAALCAHPGLDHVSFTGSPQTAVAVQTAAARHNRPVTLELGGKSPQIVFADADLDGALPFITDAIVQNAGQTCSAGSRLLVQEAVADRFLDALSTRFTALEAGPADRDLDCGPLINAKQKARVDGYLTQAARDGVRTLASGRIAANAPAGGTFVAPALLDRAPVDHPVAQEEIFGPVLTAFRFHDEAEAIALADATPFGLVAGVWTQDGGRQFRLARALRAGQVFVNNYGAGGGVELPFGGMKKSGFGREKALEGLDHFSVTKTVAIRHG